MSTNLSKPLNLATLLSLILAASGTILAVSNNNHFVGAVLAALAAVSIPLQAWLSTFVVDVPQAVYEDALRLFTALAYVVGASSLILQWFVNFAPVEKPFIVTLLGVAALACAMFTQLFHASAATKSLTNWVQGEVSVQAPAVAFGGTAAHHSNVANGGNLGG